MLCDFVASSHRADSHNVDDRSRRPPKIVVHEQHASNHKKKMFREARAKDFRTVSVGSLSAVDVLLRDLLWPQGARNPCGNIWGSNKKKIRSNLISECKSHPNSLCAWIEFEGTMKAFLMYDVDPQGLDPFAAYVDHESMWISLERFDQLCASALNEDPRSIPNTYHELLFICSQPDKRRFGSLLFEHVMQRARNSDLGSVIIFAGQAKHMQWSRRMGVEVVDEESTNRVTTRFYAPNWTQVPVVIKDGVVTHDPDGSCLEIDCGSTTMHLWIRRVTQTPDDPGRVIATAA